MKTLRHIVDERLLLGEIDVDEHARLMACLDTLQPGGEPFPTAKEKPEAAGKQATASVPFAEAASGVAGLPGGRPDEPAPTGMPRVWQTAAILGGVVVIVVIGSLIVSEMAGTGGLELGNVAAFPAMGGTGPTVVAVLANTSDRSGDVALWVEQDPIPRMCERIVAVDRNRSHRISFDCPTLRLPDGDGESLFYLQASNQGFPRSPIESSHGSAGSTEKGGRWEGLEMDERSKEAYIAQVRQRVNAESNFPEKSAGIPRFGAVPLVLLAMTAFAGGGAMIGLGGVILVAAIKIWTHPSQTDGSRSRPFFSVNDFFTVATKRENRTRNLILFLLLTGFVASVFFGVLIESIG